MEKYVITDKFVNFSIGDVLGLIDKQYESRQHLLKPLKDGKYCVSQTVQFKCGEIVGLEKAPAKEMFSKLSPCKVNVEANKIVSPNINTAHYKGKEKR